MHTIEIHLTNNKIALIDADDLGRIRKFTWSANLYGRKAQSKTERPNGYWYAVTNEKRSDGRYKHLKMHRLIMNAKKGQIVDHINGDSLDNRKENLRFAGGGRNQFNTHARRGGKSIYKGVTRSSSSDRWVASIRKNYKPHHLGNFVEEVDAAVAYDRGALKMFGEFANTNFPRRILDLLPDPLPSPKK